MHRLSFAVLAIAAMWVGCSIQPALVPSTLTRSEVCSNLLGKYNDIGHKPELVVYESSKITYKKFPIHQVDEALTYYFMNKQARQPLVLYIHGRALKDTIIGEYDREPEESRNDVMPVFYGKYNTGTVLMLHWPHRKSGNGFSKDDEVPFPEDDARFSGNALLCVIDRLNSDHFDPSKFPGQRILITHSMGALVLEQAISESSEDLHKFDSISIFAAANRVDSANSWLSKITARKQYVVINTRDIILNYILAELKFVPLGMCDWKCFEDNSPANNIIYLDITCIAGGPFHANIRHDYFVKGDVADKVVAKILRDEDPPMGIEGVSENHRIIESTNCPNRGVTLQ